METISTIKKAIAAFLTGIVTWATAVVVSEPAKITASEWVTALGMAVSAFLVWLIPNGATTQPRDPNGRFKKDAGQGGILNLLVTIIVVIILVVIAIKLIERL